MDQRALVVFRC